ncbi:unnamed protein product [Adineta steineri]|uniref:Multifunctional fusion protein n=1 Tax=Adineta steineri TaxID=433720 RepID=A0A815HW20_9BILA|nr:unnamed protein product [Adineta steineri]
MQLQIINEFEREYRPKKAIWWYTRECFTYKMLNEALRMLDADMIINMGFFIRHVHQHIQHLYKQQVSSYERKPFVVYRGQGLMKSDFEKLQKAKGGLISFNNFLSTSKNEKVSLSFARNASTKPDMVGILFIISIDPCLQSTPFASIKEESYCKEEDEILFSMHTVFQVGAIKQMDNNKQVYQVELQLTSDDDHQLRTLTDRIQEEVGSTTGWRRLGKLLLTIDEFDKAEEVYNVLLKQTSDEDEKSLYYGCLGHVKHEQGDYEKAIWYYEQGLDIKQKLLPSNHLLLATSYSNIGSVYNNKGDYATALSFYEKALEIKQKSLPSNHPSLTISYNNISGVYNNMGDYSKALTFYEKELEICHETLSSHHPLLATLYNNIGGVYKDMREYSKALLSYEKALEIRHESLPSCQKTLPSNHPSLATSYNNIGLVYKDMREYSEALSFFDKALEICQETFPASHPSLATSYNNIGLVYKDMGEYSKALSSHEIALEIQQKTLPSTHPDLVTSYSNIGLVYNHMGEYSKALSSHEKADEIRQKTLPSNHPDLATSYNNIAKVYYNMKDYSKALSYLERAMSIRQCLLPPAHPHIKDVEEYIKIVKNEIINNI